jgi:hypothetical protein
MSPKLSLTVCAPVSETIGLSKALVLLTVLYGFRFRASQNAAINNEETHRIRPCSLVLAGTEMAIWFEGGVFPRARLANACEFDGEGGLFDMAAGLLAWTMEWWVSFIFGA